MGSLSFHVASPPRAIALSLPSCWGGRCQSAVQLGSLDQSGDGCRCPGGWVTLNQISQLHLSILSRVFGAHPLLISCHPSANFFYLLLILRLVSVLWEEGGLACVPNFSYGSNWGALDFREESGWVRGFPEGGPSWPRAVAAKAFVLPVNLSSHKECS